MKKIGFIGAFNKTDLIIYIAKILTEVQKKILVIDTTTNQRARYIVPCISPSRYYITEYEGIDVAVGFNNLEDVQNYLGSAELNYDIVLFDIDSQKSFKNCNMAKAERNYFVTAFDSFSLKKGLEIIESMEHNVVMTKVLFAREIFQEDDDYLNFLSFYYPVQWEKEKIYMPYDNGDDTAIIENQRTARIRIKNLSEQYRDGLFIISQQIIPDNRPTDIKKIFKTI